MKPFFLILATVVLCFSCSNSVEYSETFKKQTTGDYLFNEDDVIQVYYKENTLFLNWRGGKLEPVAIKENEFFVADMYKKFWFVEHPETKKRYLSVKPENENDKITYDYVKAPNGYLTPSAHLAAGNYDKALVGYLEIKKQDSTSSFISERNFNRLGYKYSGNKEYEKALKIFELNIALHPYSANVYDSMAQLRLVMGDSLQAYTNYKKALEFNNGNKRAKKYVEGYKTR